MKHISLISLISLLAACAAPATTPTPAEQRTLTVMTHDSFAVTDVVLDEFESAHNVTVTVLKSGDAGTMLNTALLNKETPLADVLYGVDNTLLSRALENDLFESYPSPALAAISADLKLDSENRALPVDYGDVCLNYHKAWFADKEIAPPANISELTQPEYKGLLVTEDPATSSTGLAFVLATWAAFGDEGFRDYWTTLRANEVKVAADWETAYYTEFSGSSGVGPRPIVVSYASSPPAEVVFASQPLDDAPTASVTGAKSCFRQIEFVGIVNGTANRGLAEAWVDFMLGKTFQEDMPLNMFVYPVLPSAQLPEAFVRYSGEVESPIILDPQTIAENRERLIQEWTEIVVR
ncbi:MAG TPA: thiamine ABC transporter substrate-binding protein [Anaerolineales bacterium]|nr:thiamine ABC transporter substrate-binding protein [Anaerolineales bacterium]